MSNAKTEQYRIHKANPKEASYVYLHRRLSDNTIFYVGKGTCYRAWELKGRNKYWEAVANKHGVVVDIVFDSLSSEDAYKAEKDVIAELTYFNEKLTNMNEGGTGGLNPSEETREKQSKAKRGKTPYNKGKLQPSTATYRNPSADPSTYTFRHTSGETFEGTRYQLASTYNLRLETLGKLFYNGINKRGRIFGWSLSEDNL